MTDDDFPHFYIPLQKQNKTNMKKLFFLAVAMMAAVATSAKMSYTVEIDTVGKYLNVKLQYVASDKGQQKVELQMPIWAPGYYDVLNYPKYVTDFKATKTNGTALTWSKYRKSTWIVNMAGADTILVSYRAYANVMDVANSRIRPEGAFIAGNGTFMYEQGHKYEPVEVSYIIPDNWKYVSTGLKAEKGTKYKFIVPDFDILYDSPILFGNHFVEKFTHNGHEYEFAFDPGDDYEGSTFKKDFIAMVDAATEIMKEVPYDNYCIINMEGVGGGLEHLNSQADYSSGRFTTKSRADYIRELDFIAHEYFHLYNVKRIRPIELGPFDYSQEAFTPLLWFSEGFTSYYSAQMLRRGKIITTEELLGIYSRYIHDIEIYEGHKHMTLRQSSYDIWLDFMGDKGNHRDVAFSYYNKGSYMGLLFDAKIRTTTKNERSLDDFMRLLYNRYYKELQRGFTEEEFWQALQEIMGTTQEATDAAALLRRYVDTTDDIDYDALLNPIGIMLDHETWQLSLMEKPSKQVAKMRKALIGE